MTTGPGSDRGPAARDDDRDEAKLGAPTPEITVTPEPDETLPRGQWGPTADYGDDEENENPNEGRSR